MPSLLAPPAGIARRIKQLRLLDLENVTDELLDAQVSELCAGYTTLTMIAEIPWAHRARRHDTGVRFEHSSELWHPPAKLVKRYSRANRPGEPTLYISSHQDTALLELRPEVGEEITVLQLLPRGKDPKAKAHVMQIGLPELVAPHDPKIKSRQVEELRRGREILGSQEAIEANQMIRKFFIEEFTKLIDYRRHEQYRLCAAIAGFSTSAPRIDGLWYPSIASGATNSNIGLKPEAAHRLLRPHKCWVVRVDERVDTHKYMVQCLGNAEVTNDGRIQWN